MVGPWVIGVRESESGYRFGVKGQKNIGFGNDWLLNIGRPNMIGYNYYAYNITKLD